MPCRYTWLLAAAIFGGVALASLMLAAALSLQPADIAYRWLLALGSPSMLHDPKVRGVALHALPLLAALMLWVNRGWFLGQVRSYRPLEEGERPQGAQPAPS